MLFLMEYHRPTTRTVSYEVFSDSDYGKANAARFDRELELFVGGDDDTEVVVLQAHDERHLRRTHARYFGGESDLLEYLRPEFHAKCAVHEDGNNY